MSTNGTPTDRIRAFGRLGTCLWDLLIEAGLEGCTNGLSFLEQALLVQNVSFPNVSSLQVVSRRVLACAISLLLCDFPIQVDIPDSDIRLLASMSFETVAVPPKGSTYCLSRFKDKAADEGDRRFFPVKRHGAAESKANTNLPLLLTAMNSGGYSSIPAYVLPRLKGKVYDDQACACLLYALGLAPRFGSGHMELAVKATLQPANAKGLSTALKALGASSSLLGALLVEANVLQGRGVGELDLAAAGFERTSPAWVQDHTVPFPEDALRSAVRDILDEELQGRKLVFTDVDDFWAERWRWCVNGAHVRSGDAALGFDRSRTLPGVTRMFRRMAAECTEDEPISSWDSRVNVSAAQKLEHGKTRAIFSCDTRSYFAFEHMLSPVSAAWQHRRVILDPGRFGHLGIARRILAKHGRGGYHLMLDYDDFNSQHTTRSMQILIDETCLRVGYPDELRHKLVASFDNMYMSAAGRSVGRVLGSLMSGHRATTYINSVLNAAYIRCAVGRSLYNDLASMHVGDDVYMSTNTLEQAAAVLNGCRSAGCRMNVTKQSLGSVGAEFLRLGVRSTHAVGYLARSVASYVSGNWTNEVALEPGDAVGCAVQMVRSLMNRSGCRAYANVLAPCLASAARIKKRTAYSLLSGEAAVDGGPVWHAPGYVINYAVEDVAKESDLTKIDRMWPTFATDQYLAEAVSDLERYAMLLSDTIPTGAMLLSSYRKAVVSSRLDGDRVIALRRRIGRIPVGSASAMQLLYRPVRDGVLLRYPLLPLLRARLSTDMVKELLLMAGGDIAARDLQKEAWGGVGISKVVQGVMSYSDAAWLSTRTECGVLYSTYPVHM